MLKVNNQKSVPNIVVRFVNRKSKIRLLKDGTSETSQAFLWELKNGKM